MIKDTPGFFFSPRTRDALPNGFPEDVPGIPYFLDDYNFPGYDPKTASDPDAKVDHVEMAINYYGIKPEAPS